MGDDPDEICPTVESIMFTQQTDAWCAPIVPAGEVCPTLKGSTMHCLPTPPAGLTCTTWVPVVLPLGVVCSGVQLDEETRQLDEKTRLLAHAEECERTAAEFRATAEAMRNDPVAVMPVD